MRNANVLVVCEDPTLRKVYAKQMEILGADVRSARTVEEALAQSHSTPFDRKTLKSLVESPLAA
ncbi:MAG: response regulator [Myxococcota bacterium]